MHSSLTTALDRARAAILNGSRPAPTFPPRVRLGVPTAAPLPPSRPSCAPLDELTAAHDLKAGPRRLLSLLHGAALEATTARAYAVTPSQVTIHQPQELLARALGCHLVTVWRWAGVLKSAGLIDARAHYTSSKGATRTDGTLYAVSLKPGHRAHLTHDDLSHEWRDLDADREAGRTAWAMLQGSDQRQQTDWITALRAWAVTPGSVTDPRYSSDPCSGPHSVQDVVYLLPLLMDAHPDKRPALVGMMGAALARALNDQHSRRWYCGLIWSAYSAQWQGRGGLQQLAALLSRLAADQQEWSELRRPGALLAARLRGAGYERGQL